MHYQQTGSVSNHIYEKTNITIAAMAITLVLLFMMYKLVQIAPPELQKVAPVKLPSFTNQIEEKDVVIIKPVKNEPLPKPTNQTILFDEVDLTINDISSYSDYKYQPDKNKGIIPSNDSLVKLTPTMIVYPKAALSSGLCGWAVVQFDVNESGAITNANILESSHGVFERNSIKSVLKDRYKPMTEAGKPVSVIGKQIKITYELDGGC